MSRSAGTVLQDFTPLREGAASKSTLGPAGRRLYKDVTIIKAGLGNRRDRNYYPAETLETAVTAGRFHGLRAYADHQDSLSEEVQPERTVRDLVGIYDNARFVREGKDGGRVLADLHLFRSSKWLADNVDDLIDLKQADKIGLSINGRGQTVERQIDLEEADSPVTVNWVEGFSVLRSADVVTEAGAGGGFPQLLESARESTKETAMKRLTERQKTDIIKSVQDNDTEKLTLLMQECGCVEGTKVAAKSTKEAKGKAKGKAKAEGEDADAELDRVADEITAEAEDTDAADEPDEPLGEGEDDTEESDADEDDDEADDADEDADEADDVKEATDPLAGKGAGKLIAGRGAKNVKGVKKATGGSKFTTPMRQGTAQKGRKFGEAVDDAARIEQLMAENARLSTQLKIRSTTDRGRKLLHESSIPEKLRPEILRLMVGKQEDDMKRIVRYHENLIEAAVAASTGEFEEVEGAGSSFRESHSRGGATDAKSFVADMGLPVKG